VENQVPSYFAVVLLRTIKHKQNKIKAVQQPL